MTEQRWQLELQRFKGRRLTPALVLEIEEEIRAEAFDIAVDDALRAALDPGL